MVDFLKKKPPWKWLNRLRIWGLRYMKIRRILWNFFNPLWFVTYGDAHMTKQSFFLSIPNLWKFPFFGKLSLFGFILNLGMSKLCGILSISVVFFSDFDLATINQNWYFFSKFVLTYYLWEKIFFWLRKMLVNLTL